MSTIIDLTHCKRILEAALLTTAEPLSVDVLRRIFDEALTLTQLGQLLEEIQADWSGRGVELIQVASGWRFRARVEYMPYLSRLNPSKPPRYSRAVMETLAIIAYKQPVTRGDIETLRGVSLSSYVIQTLTERGWIEVVGHRSTPGKPSVYATTAMFLDDFGLSSLGELPTLSDLAVLAERSLETA